MRGTWALYAAAIAAGIAVLFMVNQNSGTETSTPGSTVAGASPQPSATSSLVQAFANAIAKAEGYLVPGAIPTLANNPGDLVLGDQGNGTLGSAGITVFASIDDGWNALYTEVEAILSGKSKYISPSMTIAQAAEVYAPGAQASAWANNVATALGTTPDAPIDSIAVAD